jgi:two-component system response regulator RegA
MHPDYPAARGTHGLSRMALGHLLLVDDDPVFRGVLARALSRRGFTVQVAGSVDEARHLAAARPPRYAVLDLRMPGAPGLKLIGPLRVLDPQVRVLVLTGFASISTAVEAIKLGAHDYLPKPADADEVMRALLGEQSSGDGAVPEQPLSVQRLEWEHIQRVLAENRGSVSATARALGMHRRTLQRKLAKRPVRR